MVVYNELTRMHFHGGDVLRFAETNRLATEAAEKAGEYGYIALGLGFRA
jgi:hypothetical protein